MTVEQDYTKTLQCTYKGRDYLVRDNGAILRLQKDNSRLSKYDNVWTFGEKDKQSGYMILASSIRVHQVVCTAFNGPAPFPEMVVDHLDTNRCNNRPENLRWVTRLENALGNEFTRKKIIYLCGSVKAFLDDPSILSQKALPPRISWMKTVTKAEAGACKQHLLELANREPAEESTGRGLDDLLFQPTQSPVLHFPSLGIISNYPRKELMDYCRRQYSAPMWESRVLVHTEECLFPSVPSSSVSKDNVIKEYQRLLALGVDFLISRYYKLVVIEVIDFDNGNQLRVFAKRPNGQQAVWYIFEIWTDGQVLFHQKIDSFGKQQMQKAQDAFLDLSTAGHHVNESGRFFYCEESRGRIRIRRGDISF